MRYAGGLGAGKGWNRFKFIITPSEFTDIFSKNHFYFIVTNSRVDIAYKFTPKPDISNAYKQYCHKVYSGTEWNQQEDWKLDLNARISIVDDLNKVEFEEIINNKKVPLKEYKLVNTQEPVINIAPFSIDFIGDRLSLQISNKQGYMGLELSYPKVISWREENFEKLHNTVSFEGKHLYDKIVLDIKLITKKAKLSSISKEYRPDFWISQAALLEVNNNAYLKNNNLLIK